MSPIAKATVPESDEVAAAMTKLSGLLLCFLGAAISPQWLFAGDEISQILQSWKKHYGRFAASEQYHYRCVSKRTSKTLDPSFDRSQFGEPFELGMEIFRRGPAWRMDAIRGGDFADATAPAETRIDMDPKNWTA